MRTKIFEIDGLSNFQRYGAPLVGRAEVRYNLVRPVQEITCKLRFIPERLKDLMIYLTPERHESLPFRTGED